MVNFALVFLFIKTVSSQIVSLNNATELVPKYEATPTVSTTLPSLTMALHNSRDAHNHRKRLLQTLLDPNNYDKRLRPTDAEMTAVTVVIRLNLYQILDVAEPTQTIALYTWATQMWDDMYLGWNPADYGNITEIVLPYDAVWLPDTYLYNGVIMNKELSENGINVKVSTDTSVYPPIGNIRLMYPAIYSFACNLYIRYFPFDKQICKMTFGSWTHDSAAIDYQFENKKVLLESFEPNGEWNLLAFEWNRTEVKFACCVNKWTLLDATLIIQRKPLFYLMNLVLPSAIITMVAIVGFFMPASTNGERSEKVNLGITTLLAMAILLLMVSDAMPTTSNFIPLLGWFYLNVILLTSIGTLLTSVVIWVQSQARFGQPVGDGCRQHLFKLAHWLHVYPRPQLIIYWLANGYTHNGLKRTLKHRVEGAERDATKETFMDEHLPAAPRKKMSIEQRPTASNGVGNSELLGVLVQPEAVEFEWQLLSDVLDRLLLIVFCVAVVAVTVSILVTGLLLNEEAAL